MPALCCCQTLFAAAFRALLLEIPLTMDGQEKTMWPAEQRGDVTRYRANTTLYIYIHSGARIKMLRTHADTKLVDIVCCSRSRWLSTSMYHSSQWIITQM